MADTSRRMARLAKALENQGARVRRNGAGGWTVYPPDLAKRPFSFHTSPRRPTQAEA